jgi:hypothetical protein
MAHYAQLNENNIVLQVLYVDNKFILDENGNECEELAIKQCIEGLNDPKANLVKTSYRGSIRVRYAVIGGSYNQELDAFISPKPHPSWVLNEPTVTWEAPVPEPTDAPEGSYYQWNEDLVDWELITPPTE